MRRRVWPAALLVAAAMAQVAPNTEGRRIEVWHGDKQRVGHLGNAQDDFNLMGHVEPWRELDTLEWRLLPRRFGVPLAFRAFRRLAQDGDFNADIPIGSLRPGPNAIQLVARFRDGSEVERTVTVTRETGARPLPVRITWAEVKDAQDAGQYVDGRWQLTPEGLRTAEIGYDRVFLIGDRSWQDYEITTAVTIHRVPQQTGPVSGPNGVGMILRFAGHVTGGPRHFASGQPKWGYRPFGAIGWLRWARDTGGRAPVAQFYPGDRDASVNMGHFPAQEGRKYHVRFRCETLPADSASKGVTRYSFRIWPDGESEPPEWTWSRVQESATALRRGGAVLLAHHVDATFGDIHVRAIR